MNKETQRILDLSNFLSEDQDGLFDGVYSEDPESDDEFTDKDEEDAEEVGFQGNRGAPDFYINPLIDSKYKPGARQNIPPGARG